MPAGRGRGDGRGRGGSGVGDEAPAAPPTPDEMVATLMGFDKNTDGKLTKAEVPERMQGMFERADANHDGVLTAEEIKAAAAAQPQPSGEPARRRRAARRGRPRRAAGRPTRCSARSTRTATARSRPTRSPAPPPRSARSIRTATAPCRWKNSSAAGDAAERHPLNSFPAQDLLMRLSTWPPLTLLAATAATAVTLTFQHRAQSYKFHYENVLGTSMEVTVVAASEGAAASATKAVLDRIDGTRKILSGYDPASEFSHWFQTQGRRCRYRPELYEVLVIRHVARPQRRRARRVGGNRLARVEAAAC